MRKILLATAAVIAIPLLGSAAQAAVCAPDTVANYVALGAGGCSVGPVTFTDIHVTTTVSPGFAAAGGILQLNGFTPTTFAGPGGATEFGLILGYQFFTPAGQFADILWTYNVHGNLLTDAFMSLTGGVNGNGIILLDETLSNGIVLHLNGAGTASAVFDPTANLFAQKDHQQIGGTGTSFASSSAITNAFSLNQVPLPGALPLFITGLGAMGLLGWRRKRKAQAFG